MGGYRCKKCGTEFNVKGGDGIRCPNCGSEEVERI